jgi:hypothetical protein
MATQDLTTLAQVREHMQISDASDTAQDALIGDLITVASDALMRYAQREFKTTASAGTARDFRYDGRGVLSLAPFDLQTLTSVQIDYEGVTPSPTTLTADDYRLHPLDKRDGVWNRLHLRGFKVARSEGAVHPEYRVVRVTGNWGFPTVPTTVERATIIMVAYMLRNTSQWMGDEFGVDASLDAARASIPPICKRLVDPFRTRAV